jgi:hypothetical protein
MHIWTETPVTEIWQQLRYFRPAMNVRNLLTGRTTSRRSVRWSDGEDATRRAHEIASCIEQADEYFSASRAVGLATKPLMQFYGAQSLAKTVILAGSPDVSLSQLSYHGLSTRASTAGTECDQRALREYSSDPRRWVIEREFAVTNEGVFPHLAKIVSKTIIPVGCVLTFGELIGIVPDLAQLYRRHYGEHASCFYLYSHSKPDSPGQRTFCRRILIVLRLHSPNFRTALRKILFTSIRDSVWSTKPRQ